MIRKPENCPSTRVKLLNTESSKVQFVTISFELTTEVNPTGRCCRALIPEEASDLVIVGLLVQINLRDNIPFVEGYKVHLSDQEFANVYHRKKFNIHGVELKASLKDTGYLLYNVKLHKEIYLPNNERFNCRNYQHVGDYNKVTETSKYDRIEAFQ